MTVRASPGCSFYVKFVFRYKCYLYSHGIDQQSSFNAGIMPLPSVVIKIIMYLFKWWSSFWYTGFSRNNIKDVSCVLFRHGVPSLYCWSFPRLREDWLPQRCQWKHHRNGAPQSAGKHDSSLIHTCPHSLAHIQCLTYWTCRYELLWNRKWDVFSWFEDIFFLTLSNILKLLSLWLLLVVVSGRRLGAAEPRWPYVPNIWREDHPLPRLRHRLSHFY